MVDQAQGCSGQLRWQDEFDELFDKLAMSTVRVSESGAVGPAGAGPTAGSPRPRLRGVARGSGSQTTKEAGPSPPNHGLRGRKGQRSGPRGERRG
ncbi:MAG: hypothetical protein M5U22_20500 [Thermoleophilia bacterium]|nr:hypothetical protein [Thermoleophilia bacterium]